ncbi:SDR family NAD(P)-dependent oxidoreductase [Ralstonia pseudosolanacearum]|uniref:SDR family NAD(P)-dependent oxidoreductase n=1 Tax=Ralstonia pseudosolanacearum TaxID=1310165 RepID=UPI0024A797C2|nr:SDR family NAD(P)-dependent oxidoreductase [Ralstonia pseudosolanacearum]
MFPAKIENLRRNPVCLQRYRHVVARKRQHGLTTTLIYATTPRHQGSGRIINIGSVLGFLPMPYMALYSATKHAVAGYSESIDHELRTQGIRVSVIEPAYINTPFDSNLMKPDAPLDVYREIRAGVERRVKEVLVGADGPDVVAKMVLKAATAARPKIHYAPGLASRMRLLRRFAPASVLDAGVRKDLRLEA